MKRLASVIALLVLASCASPEPTPPPPPAAPPPPETPTVAPVQTPATPLQPPRPRDACGAWELQSLVGRPRSEIPVPVDPSRRRVTCTTCPVTQDFREDRLNIFFDADTGVVKSVTCG